MRIVIALCLCLATVTTAAAQHQTQEYRMWSAEQMINRLTEKFVRAHNLCDQTRLKVWTPMLSEECKASVVKAAPILGTIREVAMSGDAVRWAELLDHIHKFETEIEAPLNSLARQ